MLLRGDYKFSLEETLSLADAEHQGACLVGEYVLDAVLLNFLLSGRDIIGVFLDGTPRVKLQLGVDHSMGPGQHFLVQPERFEHRQVCLDDVELAVLVHIVAQDFSPPPVQHVEHVAVVHLAAAYRAVVHWLDQPRVGAQKGLKAAALRR